MFDIKQVRNAKGRYPIILLINFRSRYWLIALVSGLVTLLVLFRFSRPTVEVVNPQRGQAVHAVYATGTVEPEVMLPIAPRVSARLVELGVDEGAQVSENQILARLESEDLQSALEVLRARERFAKSEFERKALLRKGNAVSAQDYERAKSEWEAAKAATEEAIAKARFLDLVAPAAGTVIRRDGEVGELIPVNQPVFWLSVRSPLRVTSEVDEEDISLVKPGQKVLVRADAFPNRIFEGVVQQITPKGDPISRSYRVRITLSEETPLRIGMTAETNIIVRDKHDALLIPATAVEDDSVWIVRDGRLKKQTVQLGIEGVEKHEVLSGLTEEDAVVLSPDPELEEQQRVRTDLRKEGE